MIWHVLGTEGEDYEYTPDDYGETAEDYDDSEVQMATDGDNATTEAEQMPEGGAMQMSEGGEVVVECGASLPNWQCLDDSAQVPSDEIEVMHTQPMLEPLARWMLFERHVRSMRQQGRQQPADVVQPTEVETRNTFSEFPNW